jgi:predicted nucleic acid-binding protein
MIVLSNTSPLIGLASIRRFGLLHQMFGHIVIPQAVYRESVTEGREVGGAKREVTAARWVETRTVTDRAAVTTLLERLDEGEAETIVLAREMAADWVIMDERRGRKILTEWGINKIGTLGILLKAKQLGLLSMIRSDIELLCQEGFTVSQEVVDAVLRYAGEL